MSASARILLITVCVAALAASPALAQTPGAGELSQATPTQAGRTTVTTTVLYASMQARDGALKSGMADGMEAGFGRLDKLLASQPAEAKGAA